LFDRLLNGPLIAHRTVLLVTHHVDLVLPRTHYLVRLSDGRIEYQGTVEELKQQGLLDYIAHDASLHPKEDTKDKIVEKAKPATQEDGNAKPKQARKVVEDEVRAEGKVKWSIYKTYLKASWVLNCYSYY